MLSDNVKKIRLEMNLSQNEFAKNCDLKRATLYRIEEGITINPTYKQICGICKGCKLTPNNVIPLEDYQ